MRITSFAFLFICLAGLISAQTAILGDPSGPIPTKITGVANGQPPSDAIIEQNIKSTLKQNGYFNNIKICQTLQGIVKLINMH